MSKRGLSSMINGLVPDESSLRKVNFFMILCMLLLFTQFSSTLAETSQKDRKIVFIKESNGNQWAQLKSLNIFNSPIQQNITSIDANGTKLIAPGTSGEYPFTISNELSTEVRYTLSVSDENLNQLPLRYRLRTIDGSWIIGGADNWVSLNEIVTNSRVLRQDESSSYILDWQWPYERAGMDAIDTAFGNQAITEQLSYQIKLSFQISQENESLVRTDDSTSQTMLTVIFLASLLILMVLFYRKKQSNRGS